MTDDSEKETSSQSEKRYLWIRAPKGFIFRNCGICGTPFCFYESFDNCMWCEIHKKEIVNDS